MEDKSLTYSAIFASRNWQVCWLRRLRRRRLYRLRLRVLAGALNLICGIRVDIHTYICTCVHVFVFIFAGTHTLTTTVCCCCLCGNLCFKLFTARLLRFSVRPIAAAALLDLTAKMRCGAVIKHDFLLYWFYSMLPTIVIMVFYSIYIQIIMTQCIFYFSPANGADYFARCTVPTSRVYNRQRVRVRGRVIP